MVDRHARVKAFALAHFSSASEAGKVPSAMVLPAHCAKTRGGGQEIVRRLLSSAMPRHISKSIKSQRAGHVTGRNFRIGVLSDYVENEILS